MRNMNNQGQEIQAGKTVEMTLASAIPVDWPDNSSQSEMKPQPMKKKLGKG